MNSDGSDDDEEQAGIIVPQDGESLDSIDTYAYPILDDVLYNVIHDIVLKAHRGERIAKANTAAIVIEQEAAETFPDLPTPSSSSKSRHIPQRIENESAIYEDGIVTIKGNPLATVHEIRCAKCGLPTLLHPTDGNGARNPEPGIEYCKRHPYIDKPRHDIYGVPFPKDDSGSTRKQKPKPASLLSVGNSQPDAADSSFESPAPSPPPVEQKPKQANIFPNVECPRCPRLVNVRVFARHLNGHLKGGGRASGRAAIMKINGQSGGVQSGVTPPVSRKSTPAIKVSPQKRSLENLEDVKYDEDERDRESPKKKIKKIPQLKVNPQKKKYGEGIVKKWKSGKITVDGKTIDQRPSSGIAREDKKGKALQKDDTGSSATLDSS